MTETGDCVGSGHAAAQSVVTLFEETAARCAAKPAVRMGDELISYAGLDALANRVARRIVESIGRGNQRIAVLLKDCPSTAAAMLGSLKAAKACVPMNASYPADRLSYILDDTEAPLIVTDAANADLADRLARGRGVLRLDEIGPETDSAPLGLSADPRDVACILYTSGSTGRPKGVVNAYRPFFRSIVDCQQAMGLREDDILGTFFSFAFAGGTRIVLRGLLKGATVAMGALDDMGGVVRVLARDDVTVASLSPSILAHILAGGAGSDMLPRLRIVYLGGEPLQRPVAERFFEAFPSGVRLINALGLTETAVFCLYAMDEMPDFEGNRVPVGPPISCMRVTLIDDHGRSVSVGEVGQIVVGTPGLSEGYWKKPDLTERRFAVDERTGERVCLTGDLGRFLPDGRLVHLGRMDGLVKIRAFAVDLSEVEAALRAHPSVKDAAVAAREDAPGDTRLIGYVVPDAGLRPTVTALRRFLSGRIPDYMVPAAFVMLDSLPVNLSGKLDRRALPTPDGLRPELDTPYAAPRTPVEERLAALWARALGLDRVGMEDNFFELGGHSILAARVVSETSEAFGVEVSLPDLFAAPTVAATAVRVAAGLVESRAGDDIEMLLAGLENPGAPADVMEGGTEGHAK